MKNQDFLLEIRTEEIPAPALLPARLELARRLTETLADEELSPASVESFATPRRLAVALRGLPERQEDRFAEVLGPPAANAFDPDGKPTRAAAGFAKAQKVDVADLVVVDSPRGPTLAARRTTPGREAADLLAEIVPRVVAELTFPKTMRWGSGDRSFVRPVRGVLALLGGRVVPMELFGVAAGDRTSGHRVLSDGDFAVTGPEDYLEKLRGHFVEPDAELRRARILEAARAMAADVGGSIEAHADLANTLSDLVEWPGLVRGSYADEFLELPEEVTVTAMRTHQKFLPVRGPTGLLPYFIAVMDNAEDRKGFIAKGCEWVLNARLADARFFFEEDVRQRLESRLPLLERLTFQDKLGSYRQKTARIQDLAEAIAIRVGRADLIADVRTAGLLSKADLTTHVVKEFTDLQGIMGGIYARRERYADSVWKAISDQYRPASASDDPPRKAAGAILSLADRFDSLVRPLPHRARADGLPRPLRAAAGRAGSRLDRDRPQLAHRLDARSCARPCPSIPRTSRAPAPRRRSRSSAASSPTGSAACSSAAGTPTTRSRRCSTWASGTSPTPRTARGRSRRRGGTWISAR